MKCVKGVCDMKMSECTVVFCFLGFFCDVVLDCVLGCCVSGVCSFEIVLNCDDKNFCINDVCDLVKGCVHILKNVFCEDGNLCMVNDICVVGLCSGGYYECE